MPSRHKLFDKAAIYFGSNVLNAAIPFLLLPILTRVLTPVDYGIISMFGLVTTFFGAFSGLSVHGAVGVRYFQMEKKELGEYVGTCIGILVVSTSVIFLFILIFGSWLTKVSGVPADWLLVAVVISGWQFLGNIRLSLWQVSEKAKEYGIFQLIQSLLNAAISLFLILIIGMAWEGRVLGQTLSILSFGFIALWRLSRDGLLRYPSDWRVHAYDALRFGVPLIPHVIGGLLIVAADRFVIVKLLGIGNVGIYMVALQVGQAIGLITESFNKAYAPWLMRNLLKPSEELRTIIVRWSYLYFLVLIIIAIAFGLFIPTVLGFLVGSRFQQAEKLIIYIAIGSAFGGCYYIVANYIFFTSKTQFIAFVTFFSGLLNILLTYLLVKYNGISGAAQAFMITQGVSFLGTWWLAQKVYPMPWLKRIKFMVK